MMAQAHFDEIAGGSHQGVLLEALRRSIGPILELGAGETSTRQIHANTINPVTTIDDEKAWLNKYMDLQSYRHTLLLLNERETLNFFINDTTAWGLVFIDTGSWVSRVAAIKRYNETADYVVVHDAEYGAATGYFGKVVDGKDDFSNVFKYWIEFKPEGLPGVPATILASNKINLKGITIKGMIILNQNK